MKILLLLVTLYTIFEQNGIIQAVITDVSSYQVGVANKTLDIFLKYIKVLDATQKKYSGNSHVHDICLTCSDITMMNMEEEKLSPINLIIMGVLLDLDYIAKMGKIRIKENDLSANTEEFKANMEYLAMFLSIMQIFEKLSARIQISSIVKDTKNYLEEIQSQTRNQPLQKFSCLAFLTRVETNEQLFKLYLQGLQLASANMYEMAGMAEFSDSEKEIVANNHKASMEKMLRQIAEIEYKEPMYEANMADLIRNQLTQSEISKIVYRLRWMDWKKIKQLTVSGFALVILCVTLAKFVQFPEYQY